jgi:hypothetical protein
MSAHTGVLVEAVWTERSIGREGRAGRVWGGWRGALGGVERKSDRQEDLWR